MMSIWQSMHSMHVRSSWPLLSRLLLCQATRLVGLVRTRDRVRLGIRWVLMGIMSKEEEVDGDSRAVVSKVEVVDGVNKVEVEEMTMAGVNKVEAEEVMDGAAAVVEEETTDGESLMIIPKY